MTIHLLLLFQGDKIVNCVVCLSFNTIFILIERHSGRGVFFYVFFTDLKGETYEKKLFFKNDGNDT